MAEIFTLFAKMHKPTDPRSWANSKLDRSQKIYAETHHSQTSENQRQSLESSKKVGTSRQGLVIIYNITRIKTFFLDGLVKMRFNLHRENCTNLIRTIQKVLTNIYTHIQHNPNKTQNISIHQKVPSCPFPPRQSLPTSNWCSNVHPHRLVLPILENHTHGPTHFLKSIISLFN